MTFSGEIIKADEAYADHPRNVEKLLEPESSPSETGSLRGYPGRLFTLEFPPVCLAVSRSLWWKILSKNSDYQSRSSEVEKLNLEASCTHVT